MEKLSAGKLRRYHILRHLFVGDKTFEDLSNSLTFPDKNLVRELEYLLTQHNIKKLKEVEEEAVVLNDVTIAADLLGVSQKKKKKAKYSITKAGIEKLAYWDFFYDVWKHADLPEWITANSEKYFAEVNRIAEEKNFQSKL